MTSRNIRLMKVLIWLACLVPAARLVFLGVTGGLGANPIEFITLSTGIWTLILLLASLAVTPLRVLTGRNWIIRFRRLLGLFAFFYASLHFTTYIWLDKFFDVHEMIKDVGKRRFITAGFSAFLMLIPLAATSTRRAVARLGPKWQALHRLVYFSASAAVIHFWWKVKADVRNPAIFASVLCALLAFRIGLWAIRRARANAPTYTSPQQDTVTTTSH